MFLRDLTHFFDYSHISCEYVFELPNIFTPNSDQYNEYFTCINCQNIQSIRTLIFNRWGNEVSESNDMTILWDGLDDNGNHSVSGVYYYIIEFSHPKGTEQISEAIQLIRW